MNDRNYGYGDNPGGDGVPGGPGGPGGPNNPGGPGGPGGPNGPYGTGSSGYEGPSSSSSGSGGGNNKGILIGVGALVAIVVLALGAFMFLGGDDETETTATETTANGEDTGGETTTDGDSGATTGNDETTATTTDETTTTEAAGSGASTGDGSMTAPYSNVVPAYVRDNAENCREAEATITSYDTGAADRTVPGMRCRGADGSLLEGNNIELIDDDEFARGSTDQARTMDYEIIKEEGGVTLIAAAYSGGSSKIYWADENEGISLELYPYDNLEEAKAAAEQMK